MSGTRSSASAAASPRVSSIGSPIPSSIGWVLFGVLFLLSGLSSRVGAAWERAGAEAGLERTLSPYFFVQSDDPEVDRMPLLGTSTAIHVSGVIAEVTVKQSYQNDGTRPIHAKYVFPASTRAAVHGLTMRIGDHLIRAQIRERETAQREFAAAKEAGKNAALLEQQRPNVFTMDVANLMPGQRIDVELEYTELLVPTDRVYELVFPKVVGPRYSSLTESAATEHDQWLRSPYTHDGEAPHYTFDLAVTLNAGLPVDQLASPSHRVQAVWTDPSSARVVLDPSEQNGGNRDFVLRYRLDGGQIQSGLMLYEGEDENFFVLMLQPPRRPSAEQLPPREYIFVVDVSGSMRGFPLDTSRMLLHDLIGSLRSTDTFNVVFFSGASLVLAPASLPATEANIEAALAMLDRQDGGGGTELLAALRTALALPSGNRADERAPVPTEDAVPRSRSILVVTDGYIGAEKEVFTYIREHLDEANVFCFGIGSGVNRYLIDGVAKAGRGEPFVVLEPGGAPAVAGKFREYVEFPVLTDIRVEYDGFAASDVEPAAIPDLMAERPILVSGKWRGDPEGTIRVTGSNGSGPFRESIDVSETQPSEANRALRHLWARTRIADISDFSFGRETAEEKNALVELGLRYSLLTKYTSFIAVHEVIRNHTGSAEDVVQPLPLPAGVSDSAVGEMGSGAEPGLLVLLVCAVASTLLFLRYGRTKPCR